MWAFFARRVRVSILCFLWRARAAERVVKRKGSRKGGKSGVTFPRRAERRCSRPTRRTAPKTAEDPNCCPVGVAQGGGGLGGVKEERGRWEVLVGTEMLPCLLGFAVGLPGSWTRRTSREMQLSDGTMETSNEKTNVNKNPT